VAWWSRPNSARHPRSVSSNSAAASFAFPAVNNAAARALRAASSWARSTEPARSGGPPRSDAPVRTGGRDPSRTAESPSVSLDHQGIKNPHREVKAATVRDDHSAERGESTGSRDGDATDPH